MSSCSSASGASWPLLDELVSAAKEVTSSVRGQAEALLSSFQTADTASVLPSRGRLLSALGLDPELMDRSIAALRWSSFGAQNVIPWTTPA